MADLVEYPHGTTFPGEIGRTVSQSSPAWPAPTRAREGAPNVLFFVLDDTGFSQLGCYGGLVDTPNLDRLAANGLRYSNMHTTAICSPTRSCILTGRNHHSNGVASIMEFATGFPGYNCIMPFENGFLSEILKEKGYNTYAIGKWHLTPSEYTSAAGPYDLWPVGRGFERFYGFMGGETNQWYPDLVYDNHSIPQPKQPEDGYHVNEDLADQAIQFIGDAKVNAPDKPFFLYYATGAVHAPHHAPREWIDKYKGKFDLGWDQARETILQRQKEMGIVPSNTELPHRDPDTPEWDSLSADEKRLYARMMEVFAGFLEHTDYHFGRILQFLEETGELDNTLIMVISDNGASPEGGVGGSVNEMNFFNYVPESLEQNLSMIDELGGPKTHNHYPWGWAWAGNTPFQRWKKETYRGGTSDPFIVHWPSRIEAKGAVRTQYAHAIDMLPTVMECLGLEPPQAIKGVTQSPFAGVSFADSFNIADAPDKHLTQYFECLGHRSIYHDGWRAVCAWPGPSFAEAAQKERHLSDEITPEILDDLEMTGWELYHVAEDFSESNDLASQNPAKLRELISIWWAEAGKFGVLPIDGTLQQRGATVRPQVARPRTRFVYYPDGAPVPTFTSPPIMNRPHSITAEVEIPAGGAEGILMAAGGVTGGYAFYVKDKKLHYVHNYMGSHNYTVSSVEEVPEGKISLRYEFEVTIPPEIREGKGAGGNAQLYIDGRLVGDAEFAMTTPIIFGLEGLSCGYDFGDGVTEEYKAPFRFTGKISRVTV
ncbi:MAG: arylsulfatase, partial [Chloroflexi bacterium]|nr:arylsulfatase [Chloroflexota bacterium]